MEKEEKPEVVEEKKEKKEKQSKKSLKEWERETREKINENRDISNYLDDVDAMNENQWSIKGLLARMTLVYDVSRDERNSHIKSMLILGVLYVLGLLIIVINPDDSWLGYILVGAASFWKFFTWGSEVDDYNVKTGNVSYTARTDMFGQVKVEQNTGNVGCIMGIIGLALGIVVTPILFLRSLFRFFRARRAFDIAKEIVEDMESHLKVRYVWNKKKSKWDEIVL